MAAMKCHHKSNNKTKTGCVGPQKTNSLRKMPWKFPFYYIKKQKACSHLAFVFGEKGCHCHSLVIMSQRVVMPECWKIVSGEPAVGMQVVTCGHRLWKVYLRLNKTAITQNFFLLKGKGFAGQIF